MGINLFADKKKTFQFYGDCKIRSINRDKWRNINKDDDE